MFRRWRGVGEGWSYEGTKKGKATALSVEKAWREKLRMQGRHEKEQIRVDLGSLRKMGYHEKYFFY